MKYCIYFIFSYKKQNDLTIGDPFVETHYEIVIQVLVMVGIECEQING